jgi:hypothetical protein
LHAVAPCRIEKAKAGGLTMTDEHPTTGSADFKLERYKYILLQLHALNESTHRYLTLFQTLATAVIGGGVVIFTGWQQLKIQANVARVGIHGIMGLLLILTLFVVFSILINVFSWVDYRREEVQLLDEVVGPGFRKGPRWRHFWRWNETYLVIFIAVVITAIFIFVRCHVIPLIK